MILATLALPALNTTDPDDEDEYLGLWCSLAVNLPGGPVASAWCSGTDHVVLDANGVPAALVDALVSAGVVELAGRAVRSGFCSYASPSSRGAFSGGSATTRRPFDRSPPVRVRTGRPADTFPAGHRHPSGPDG